MSEQQEPLTAEAIAERLVAVQLRRGDMEAGILQCDAEIRALKTAATRLRRHEEAARIAREIAGGEGGVAQ